ncbi:VanZ family protein [Deinococcus detaillensis]|uniref:VanZ family protein n=1 Tax=Deinococcus detaillensis TaxID=2592048 RepID=UPI00298BD362|nr:VanZ family protein [Deinococcus detaillensis]
MTAPLSPAPHPPANRLWWLPTLALMAVIWVLSSRADPIGIPLPHPLDWAAHFVSYAALGFCAARASGSWTLGWVLAAWFGAFDEVHQAFVPGREAGISDWWFDLLGAALGSRLTLGRVRALPKAERSQG